MRPIIDGPGTVHAATDESGHLVTECGRDVKGHWRLVDEPWRPEPIAVTCPECQEILSRRCAVEGCAARPEPEPVGKALINGEEVDVRACDVHAWMIRRGVITTVSLLATYNQPAEPADG